MSSLPTAEEERVAPFVLDEFPEGAAPAASRPVAEAGRSPEFELLFLGEEPEDPLERVRLKMQEAEEHAAALGREAAAELKKAKGEAGQIRQKAYDEGYQQGKEEGLTAGRVRVEAALDNLGRLVVGLGQAKAESLVHLEPEMVALVQAALDRIFLTENAVSPRLIRQVVGEAVRRLAESESLTVKVSPADLKLVEEYRPALLAECDQLKRLKLEADPALKPGDCLVSSSDALLDATLATRRERIARCLEESLHRGGPVDLSAPDPLTPAELEAALAARPDAPAALAPPPAAPAPPAGQPADDLEDW